MSDEPQQRPGPEPANNARSDGLASIAIMLLAVALIVFLITRIV